MKKTKSKAGKLCKGADPIIKEQLETLASALISIQDKIEEQIPVFADAMLCQEVTTSTGETMLKQNPITQEFRALVKDYITILTSFKKIVSENKSPVLTSDIAEIRKKFNIVK